MFVSSGEPMTYALVGIAMLVSAVLAWRAWRAAVEDDRARKEERRRKDDK
jgi:hypothetical protein